MSSTNTYQYRGKDNLLLSTATRAEFDSWLRKLTMEIESSNHPKSLIDRLITNNTNNAIVTETAVAEDVKMGNNNNTASASSSLISDVDKEKNAAAIAAITKTTVDELNKFSRYAYMIIFHSLSNDLSSQFTYISMNNPFALLNAVRQLFQSFHTRSQHEVREECMNVKMMNTENIYQYYSRIQRLKAELIISFTDKSHTANINLDQEVQSYFIRGLLLKYKEQAKLIIGTKFNNNNQIIPTATGELVERLAIYERQLLEYNKNTVEDDSNNEGTASAFNTTGNKNHRGGSNDKNHNNFNKCKFCNQNGKFLRHSPEQCWMNPANPDNRIEEFRKKGKGENNNSGGNGNKSYTPFTQCNQCSDKRPHSIEFCLQQKNKSSVLSTKRSNNSNTADDSDGDDDDSASHRKPSHSLFHITSNGTKKPEESETSFCYSSKNSSNNLFNVLKEEATSSQHATLDSGASDHFFYDRKFFTSLSRLEHPIFVSVASNHATQKITHKGIVQFYIGSIPITLQDVLYSPSFKVNLLSVSQLTKQNISVTFNETDAQVTSRITGKVITAQLSNNLFVIPIIHNSMALATAQDETKAFNATAESSVKEIETSESGKSYEELLHHRFGHLSKSSIHKLINDTNDPTSDKVFGLKKFNPDKGSKNKCESCLVGKSHRKPFADQSSEPVVSAIMNKFVSDLCGPISANSANGKKIELETIGGNKYLLLVIDVYSSKYFGVLMNQKSEAAPNIIQLIKRLQTFTERKLKVFHSDGGGEFKANKLKQYFLENGTHQTFTTAGTPQHNGEAERGMRTLFEMVRSMLAHCKLPSSFWGAGITTAIYIRNRTLLIRDTNKTSEELFTSNKPCIKHFRVFGCDAHVHQQHRTKLEAKTKPGIMIGYGDTIHYYCIYMIETGKIIVTRDVEFNENLFTHAEQIKNKRVEHARSSSIGSGGYISSVSETNTSGSNTSIDSHNELDLKDLPAQSIDYDSQYNVNNNNISTDFNDYENENDNEFEDEKKSVSFDANVINISDDDNKFDQSERAIHVPSFPLNTNSQPSNLAIAENQTQTNVRKSNRKTKAPNRDDTFDPDMLSPEDRRAIFNERSAYYTALIKAQSYFHYEPDNYNQAISCPDSDEWISAMQLEFKQLTDNKTWTLVELPTNRKTIKCKWVYKVKLDSDENIEKFKARFVAKGFTQKYGIDYNETFAPVMKYTSLRILLAIATIRDYEIKQFDVETAFLHATVKEEIYVEQPQGFQEQGKEHLVCKLNKSLYGLKQAPNEWNQDIDNTLVNELHYTRSINDQCVYIKQSKTNQPMILRLFVDDIISIYSKQDEAEWYQLKQIIETVYKIKDLGDAKWILKMRIIRDRKNKTLTLDQESYVNKIINKFNMNESGSPSNPCSTSVKLCKDQRPQSVEEQNAMKSKPYLQLVGSLLYAAISTRIDISYIVARLTRFNANPGKAHWKAAKQVVKYLKGNTQSRLYFKNTNNEDNNYNNDLIVSGYCDSDWASDTDDRKSTSGYIVKINDCPINWLSKKQSIVALSSAEAELLALAALTKEIIWTRNFVAELTLQTKLNYSSPIESKIWCDNQSAIQIAKNDSTSGKTKHISIRYYFIRHYITDKQIELNWISTANQQADILTKALGNTQFHKLKQLLMID